MFGKKLPANEPIGESWEVSCRDNDNNIIRNGEFAGKTLADVFKQNPVALVGPSFAGQSKFPLLNKFIDAHELLSVQVHPNEKTAPRFPGAEAKTEAWYIIYADPEATLVKGLKPGVTREAFKNAIGANTVPELLNSFPVSTGDIVFVPAGCVHAMGKDLVICEIQQNSDTTFRVYDWGRVGSDGKPRQLHVEQALEAINFNDRSPEKVRAIQVREGNNRRTYLLVCRYFAMQLLALEEPSRESTGGKRFDSLMVTGGNAVIRTKDGLQTRISTGDSALVPASVGDYQVSPKGHCEMMKIFVPDMKAEMEELRARGVAEETIRRIAF